MRMRHASDGFALSGLADHAVPQPGALPRAGMFQPLRGKNEYGVLEPTALSDRELLAVLLGKEFNNPSLRLQHELVCR